MILESFEIENWGCIRRLAVSQLPPNGLVVFHGPNGTGKSSIIAALRACLMDFPAHSTSKELKRWFPKTSASRPRVSVVFRAQGAAWRIVKAYGTRDSVLSRRQETGGWHVQVATAPDAHEQTQELVGGADSARGLPQLLWLTQAEFRLPDPKEFDADVQSQLRSVLGVLQTPLDDRIVQRLKKEWSRWYTAHYKPGQNARLKKDCSLDKSLALLDKHRLDLGEIEASFQNFEKLTEKCSALETQAETLRQELAAKMHMREELQREYEKSLKRLEAHRLAGERVQAAEKACLDLQIAQERHAEVERLAQEAEQAARLAEQLSAERSRRLEVAEKKMREHREEVKHLCTLGRECQDRRDEVDKRMKQVRAEEQRRVVLARRQAADRLQQEIDTLTAEDGKLASPDSATLRSLEENRAEARRLRADVKASAMALTIIPEVGAAAPQLILDGLPIAPTFLISDGKPLEKAVQQHAEIIVPGWGAIRLARGSDLRNVAQMEAALAELDRSYADTLAGFAVAPDAPDALARLRQRASEKAERDAEIRRRRDELQRLVAAGPVVMPVGETATPTATSADLPESLHDLEELAAKLKAEFASNEEKIRAAEQKFEAIGEEIDGSDEHAAPRGLRQQAGAAQAQSADALANVRLQRSELDRLPLPEQLQSDLVAAQARLADARASLQGLQLSVDEQTVRERLEAAKREAGDLDARLTQVENEFNHIKGVLSHTEGLHERRAAAAAQVEWLTHSTERERLECQAIDRLYTLFEECREKQFDNVMGPIHARVLNWIKTLPLPQYQAIQFNDQFLPDKLLTHTSGVEFPFDEESTGTIEQMALMVRLALGAALSRPGEPALAVLDDPLTHSDADRLQRMHAVLHSAAAGDPSTVPPAGPLQILLFTCHPEWFRMPDTRMIDLGDPSVLTPFASPS